MACFIYERPVRFHDVDAAGIVFFARYFHIAHDAFETWMRSIGFPLEKMIEEKRYLLPLVHAEADYRVPLRLGQIAKVTLEPAEISERSFTLRALVASDQEETHASVKTVHACVDVATGRPLALPDDLREAIAARLP